MESCNPGGKVASRAERRGRLLGAAPEDLRAGVVRIVREPESALRREGGSGSGGLAVGALWRPSAY